MRRSLSSARLSTCKIFVPPITTGRVMEVYDGDTIVIAAMLPYYDDVFKFRVRLRHINCPEIKTKSRTEKMAGLHVRDRLNERALNKYVKLSDVGYDNFGRILANVHDGQGDFAKWLLENRYAVKYDGRKKNNPPDWLKYMDSGKTKRWSALRSFFKRN